LGLGGGWGGGGVVFGFVCLGGWLRFRKEHNFICAIELKVKKGGIPSKVME